MLKQRFLAMALLLIPMAAGAQSPHPAPFRGQLENAEYGVYMSINFYEQDVNVPLQDAYGPLPGFLARRDNGYCWFITDCELASPTEAHLELVNDYGSEDLTALLTCDTDSIFTLRQLQGSTLKIPRNGKWLKLPRVLQFRRMGR